MILRTLLVEDNPDDIELISMTLAGSGVGMTLVPVDSFAAMERALQQDPAGWDAVVMDYRLPDADGIETLERIRALCPAMPVVVLSGALPEDVAIELLKLGATDYVAKQSLPRLVPVLVRVAREVRAARTRREWIASRLARLSSLLEASQQAGSGPAQPYVREALAIVRELKRGDLPG